MNFVLQSPGRWECSVCIRSSSRQWKLWRKSSEQIPDSTPLSTDTVPSELAVPEKVNGGRRHSMGDPDSTLAWTVKDLQKKIAASVASSGVAAPAAAASTAADSKLQTLAATSIPDLVQHQQVKREFSYLLQTFFFASLGA